MTFYSRAQLAFLCLLSIPALCPAASVPDDFPIFSVPTHEEEMTTLRELFWHHYPGAGPKATLWDEWLPDASLWPAIATDSYSDKMRQHWNETLSSRIVDSEGYVATHQHGSIAHQLGWPFPFWNQGRRGCGWHFSLKTTAPAGYKPRDLSKPDGWTLVGAKDAGISDDGWQIEVTNHDAVITARPWKCHTFEVPFLQIRWQRKELGTMQPFIEWTTPGETNFSAARRFYFEPPKPNEMVFTMVPMYRHPQWTGEVAQLRIGLGNSASGNLSLQAFFSQYDTRHNINGQNFIRGCAKYFWWTRDLNFLRANINRMRTALRFIMSEHQTLQRNKVFTPWVGHDGRSGLKRSADGKKEILTGQGIGNNYWDLLPFGGDDTYATIQYYDALRVLAALEGEIKSNPQWGIPGGALAFEPGFLEDHAADVKGEANRLFWNNKTGRFVACVDSDDQRHDYGFTFLNCESIYYDLASPEHAQAIMAWLSGNRVVEGDTAQGADIYHWRFAARSTTRRNLDWYFWAWSNPEGIPWGGQVQDGGAVLGFAYHDLMARLQTLGPDNAWERLREILRWYEEVKADGGYRQYYNGQREGSLQGGGTAGGLGLDQEFFESAMVPQIMLKGFLGFSPAADGFSLDPRLPRDWPELMINQIRFQNSVLKIRAKRDTVEITNEKPIEEPIFVRLPAGAWKGAALAEDGSSLGDLKLKRREKDGAFALRWEKPTATWRLIRGE